MKYPQSVPMPRDVEDWLEGELEARGIDAVVYTRYILSLLRQDSIDPCDSLLNLQPTKGGWSGSKCKRSELDRWSPWDDEALRRLAVVRCLMSASDQKCDIETLVDELCAKLKVIQSGTVEAKGTFPKRCESPLFTSDYNTAFPPLRGEITSVGKCSANSTWTRGILRASLDRTDSSLPYDDIINAEDCFSLMYCGPQKAFEPLDDILSEKAPGRLYERVADRGINRILNKFENNIEDNWKSNYVPPASIHPSALVPDQYYFFNYHNLFSPTLFGFGSTTEEAPQTTWSLGGTATSLRNHWQDGSCFKEVAPTGPNESTRVEPREPLTQPAEEEDLLTSARTHFRPIRSEDSAHHTSNYADGTTFAISTELEELPFQRSESGTLFLETGKYMEYKKEDAKEEGSQEFVPKFRVRQSNEKCCQTEDIGDIDQEEDSVPTDTSESSVSDPDEFFFPGDDILAQDINTEDYSYENEVADARTENIHAVENVIELSLQPPDPALVQISDIESDWDADDAALVDGLVNEDYSWKTPSDDNLKSHLESDEIMDGLEPSSGHESDSEKPTSLWPNLTESIWNPINPALSCTSCKGASCHDDVSANNLMPKTDWQEIWNPTKDDDPNLVIPPDAWKTADTDKITQRFCNGPCNEKENKPNSVWHVPFTTAQKNYDDWNNLEENENVDWSSFGPIGLDKNLPSFESLGCRFPRLGAALSAYLEESRVRAFELFNVWSPVNATEEDNVAKKPNEWRSLWSPVRTSEAECLVHFPNAEWREIWSPAVLQINGEDVFNERASTYTQLREELSEDGDQLLSDLSCLHLKQLGTCDYAETSEVLEDDSFPTNPPSPVWCKETRITQAWGPWEVEAPVEDLQKRNYNNETAQKERKRRNSSSQKVCELYMEGECRRPHCRFLHSDAAIPCPFFDDASCTRGDACPLSHIGRAGREPQRAFTL